MVNLRTKGLVDATTLDLPFIILSRVLLFGLLKMFIELTKLTKQKHLWWSFCLCIMSCYCLYNPSNGENHRFDFDWQDSLCLPINNMAELDQQTGSEGQL